MTAHTLMVQGTASNVGKSLLVTALCRIFHQDGWQVAPFKSQNMSNNSYITPDGLEIGRAQGVQAEAACIPATADMNPVLLKPSGERESQVVIHGRPYATMDFISYRREGFSVAANAISSSLARLTSQYEVVIIEGAGSPAEVNLRERELVNMRIAEWANAPVLLVADIDRGGALASLVGTLALLEPEEQERVAGLVINKFRGDRGLLQPAISFLEQRTGKPVVGVLPYLEVDLEAEDSLALPPSALTGSNFGLSGSNSGLASSNLRLSDGNPGLPRASDEGLRIVALRLPQVSNFTDLDPLRQSPGVRVDWVHEPAQLDGADAVVIPGSKNTAADLRWMWHSGLGAALQRLAARGVPVVGICGGYQMLGSRVLDPDGHESRYREAPGIELLDIETVFAPAAEKVTERTNAVLAHGVGPFAGRSGTLVSGYEIHMGRTRLGFEAVPLFRAEGRIAATAMAPADRSAQAAASDRSAPAAAADGAAADSLGASDATGHVWGTYLHDIFHNDGLRRSWLAWLWRRRGLMPPSEDGPSTSRAREDSLDRLAAEVRAGLDMKRIYAIMGLVRR